MPSLRYGTVPPCWHCCTAASSWQWRAAPAAWAPRCWGEHAVLCCAALPCCHALGLGLSWLWQNLQLRPPSRLPLNHLPSPIPHPRPQPGGAVAGGKAAARRALVARAAAGDQPRAGAARPFIRPGQVAAGVPAYGLPSRCCSALCLGEAWQECVACCSVAPPSSACHTPLLLLGCRWPQAPPHPALASCHPAAQPGCWRPARASPLGRRLLRCLAKRGGPRECTA